MKTKLLVLSFIGIVLFSCSPKIVPPPPTTNVKQETISGSVAEEGKSLYENNCAKCHKLYDAKEFSKEEWKPIVMRMQKKAHIDDVTREKIYNYLTANL